MSSKTSLLFFSAGGSTYSEEPKTRCIAELSHCTCHGIFRDHRGGGGKCIPCMIPCQNCQRWTTFFQQISFNLPLLGIQITISLSCWDRQIVVSGISDMISINSQTPYSVTSQSFEKHLDLNHGNGQKELSLTKITFISFLKEGYIKKLDNYLKFGERKSVLKYLLSFFFLLLRINSPVICLREFSHNDLFAGLGLEEFE